MVEVLAGLVSEASVSPLLSDFPCISLLLVLIEIPSPVWPHCPMTAVRSLSPGKPPSDTAGLWGLSELGV